MSILLSHQCKSVTFRGRVEKIDVVVKFLHRLKSDNANKNNIMSIVGRWGQFFWRRENDLPRRELMIFSHGGVPLYGLYIDLFWNF